MTSLPLFLPKLATEVISNLQGREYRVSLDCVQIGQMTSLEEGQGPEHRSQIQQDSSSTILRLPEELLAKIFRHVTELENGEEQESGSRSDDGNIDGAEKYLLHVQLTCKTFQRVSTPIAFETVRLSTRRLNDLRPLPLDIKGQVRKLILDHHNPSLTSPTILDGGVDLSHGAADWVKVRTVYFTAQMTEAISEQRLQDQMNDPSFDEYADTWISTHPALTLLRSLSLLTILTFDGIGASDSGSRTMGKFLGPETLDTMRSLKRLVLGVSCKAPHALLQIAPHKSPYSSMSAEDSADFEVEYVYRDLAARRNVVPALAALSQSVRTVLSSPRTKILRIVNSSKLLGEPADEGGNSDLPVPLLTLLTGNGGVQRAVESESEFVFGHDGPIGRAVSRGETHRVRWIETPSADPEDYLTLTAARSSEADLASDPDAVSQDAALSGLVLNTPRNITEASSEAYPARLDL